MRAKRSYCKKQSSFWTGTTGRAIRRLVKEEGRPELWVVADFLISSPHANMLGIYYLPTVYLCHDTGLSEDVVLKALETLSELGFCSYYPASEWCWVVEMAHYQLGALKHGDNRVVAVNRTFESLPDNPFLAGFFEKYAEDLHIDEELRPAGMASPSQAPSEDLRSLELEHDQEIEHDQDLKKKKKKKQEQRRAEQAAGNDDRPSLKDGEEWLL